MTCDLGELATRNDVLSSIVSRGWAPAGERRYFEPF